MGFKSRFLTFCAKKIFIFVTVNTFCTQFKVSFAVISRYEWQGSQWVEIENTQFCCTRCFSLKIIECLCQVLKPETLHNKRLNYKNVKFQ